MEGLAPSARGWLAVIARGIGDERDEGMRRDEVGVIQVSQLQSYAALV